MNNAESKIKVVVNGESLELNPGVTVSQLLELRGIQHRALAVEKNLEIIPQSELDHCILTEGDSVEIVSLVGGG